METILTLRIDQETAVKARVAAAEMNQSRSALVRDLLNQYLEKREQTGNGATAQHAITQGVNYDA